MEIRISNFKALVNGATLSDSGICFLTGQNGSGKSSIVQFLRLLKENIYHPHHENYELEDLCNLELTKMNLGSFHSILSRGSRSNSIIVELKFDDTLNYLLEANAEGKFLLTLEYVAGSSSTSAILRQACISTNLDNYAEPIMVLPGTSNEKIDFKVNYQFFLNHFIKNKVNISDSIKVETIIDHFKEKSNRIVQDEQGRPSYEDNSYIIDEIGFQYSIQENPKEINFIEKQFDSLLGIKSVSYNPINNQLLITHKEGKYIAYNRTFDKERQLINAIGVSTFHQYPFNEFLRDLPDERLEIIMDENKEEITKLKLPDELIDFMLGRTSQEVMNLFTVAEEQIFEALLVKSASKHMHPYYSFAHIKLDEETITNFNPIEKYVYNHWPHISSYPYSLLPQSDMPFGLLNEFCNELCQFVFQNALYPLSVINYFDGVNLNIKKRYSRHADEELYNLFETYSSSNDYCKVFLKNWFREFGIGDDFRMVVEEDGGSFKPEINKNNSWYPLPTEGTGKSKLAFIILHLATRLIPKKGEFQYLLSKTYRPYSLSSYYPNILFLEEPEAFLHPNFQSKLADMFVDAAGSRIKQERKADEPGLILVVETHSEYLIRRMQYLKATKGFDGVSIYYFGNNEYWEINFDKNGRLSRPFGRGFFDEADELSKELFIQFSRNPN